MISAVIWSYSLSFVITALGAVALMKAEGVAANVLIVIAMLVMAATMSSFAPPAGYSAQLLVSVAGLTAFVTLLEKGARRLPKT